MKCNNIMFVCLISQVWQPVMKPLTLRRGTADINVSMTCADISYGTKMAIMSQQQGWASSLPPVPDSTSIVFDDEGIPNTDA